MIDDDELRQSTAAIVKSYVLHNRIPVEALGDTIRAVSRALLELDEKAAPSEEKPPEPAVPIKKSISHDHITCLEDGKTFKSLRRHLSSEHGLSPDQYRARWGLPRDYPMVAPRYAEERSNLAKTLGLGLKAAPVAPAPAKEPKPRKPKG